MGINERGVVPNWLDVWNEDTKRAVLNVRSGVASESEQIVAWSVMHSYALQFNELRARLDEMRGLARRIETV